MPSGTATDESSTWYYAESGIPQGPVGLSELKRLARGGRIGAGTLYWTSGLDQWTTGSDIPQLKALWPAGADPGAAAGGVSLPARGHRDSPGQAPAAPRVSPLAMGSLALNLFCGVGNLAAIVAGAMALRQIARSNGVLAGKRLAVVGVVLGTAGLILSALAGVWYFWKGIGPG